MYNSDVKERFISEFTTALSRRHTALKMFNALEPYEERLGQDICTFDKDSLHPIVDELVGFREKSQRMQLSILKKYIEWCKANNIADVSDAIFEIKDVGLDKLKRQTVANPQHLQRFLNCICDKESEETVDCIYRAFFWFAYGGLGEEDTLLVTASDIDFDSMLVRYKGGEYPIYREAIPALKNCINLKKFNLKHPNREKVVIKLRADGDVLLRGMTASKSYKSVRAEMTRKIKNMKFATGKDADDDSLKLKLSYYRVWLSGLFYRMYEAERAGFPVDFMPAAKQFMEGKTYRLEKSRNLIGAKQRQLSRDYLDDYNRWKEVYSV